jgi:hypothetical protein
LLSIRHGRRIKIRERILAKELGHPTKEQRNKGTKEQRNKGTMSVSALKTTLSTATTSSLLMLAYHYAFQRFDDNEIASQPFSFRLLQVSLVTMFLSTEFVYRKYMSGVEDGAFAASVVSLVFSSTFFAIFSTIILFSNGEWADNMRNSNMFKDVHFFLVAPIKVGGHAFILNEFRHSVNNMSPVVEALFGNAEKE